MRFWTLLPLVLILIGCGEGTSNDGDCGGQDCCKQASDCPAGYSSASVCGSADGVSDCQDTDCAVRPGSCGLELIGGVYTGRKTIDNGNYDESYLVIWPFYDHPMPGLIVFFSYISTGRWYAAYQAGDCVFYDQLIPGFCSPGCNPDEWCTPDDVCETLPGIKA
jgi:hypothetical protein